MLGTGLWEFNVELRAYAAIFLTFIRTFSCGPLSPGDLAWLQALGRALPQSIEPSWDGDKSEAERMSPVLSHP